MVKTQKSNKRSAQVNKPATKSRKPRLLWASPFCLLDTSSGASMSVREMLLQLLKRGYDVQVVGATIFDAEKGTTRLNEHWDAVQQSDKKVINVNDGPLTHRLAKTGSIVRDQMTAEEEGTWYALYVKMLNEFRPDLVWFYGGQALDMLIPYEARIRGIPSAAYLANGNYQGRRWCQDVDTIITDSQATADMYEASQGFKAVPVGKFIDSSRVVAGEKSPKHLTFINPSLAKGAAVVVQLAVLLEKRRPDITIEVVESRGNWHALVKQLTAKLGDSRDSLDNVIITPNTDDMRLIYGRSRILLAPSLWWESSGRVLAEAMLNGIPAIVTNRGGMPEMIGNGGLKIDFPASCYEKPFTTFPTAELLAPLIQRIEQLYDNEALYQQYVDRAVEQSKQHRIETNTVRLMKVFAPLIQQRAGENDCEAIMEKQHKHSANVTKESNTLREYPSQIIEVLVNKGAANQKRIFIPRDEVFRIRNIFQHQEYALPENWTKKDNLVVVDIGANVGCFALYAQDWAENVTIYSFEPNPQVFPLLEKNTAHMGDNIQQFAMGLSNQNGEFTLYQHPRNTGEASMVPTHKHMKEVRVPVSHSGKILSQQGVNKIDVLKIDTEGSEVPIIEGLKELLPRTDIVMYEYHSLDDRDTLAALLEDFHVYSEPSSQQPIGTIKAYRKNIDIPA